MGRQTGVDLRRTRLQISLPCEIEPDGTIYIDNRARLGVLPKVSEILESNLAYEFIVVGIAWTAIAVVLGLVLVLWPALTCLVAGILLKFLSSTRITWPWAVSSAVLGFLVSAYQAFVAAPFVSGTFSSIGIETLAGFALFALVHLVLLYLAYSPKGEPAK